jgi:hypothetical protein
VSGRRCLRADAPRLLGKHDGVRGRWYREAWRALVADHGPLSGLARLEAGRTAVAWVQYRAATVALEDARRQREAGRGRRPSPRLIERLARRQGLADQSYSAALDKLRALVVARQNGRGDPLAAVRRAVTEANHP